jgi:methylase of polypeptide subunit release factors
LNAALVLADPPYVPSGSTHEHPGDADERIDGGTDGLDLVWPILDVARRILHPHGSCLLQLGGDKQVDVVAVRAPEHGLRLADVRHFGPDRAVARFEKGDRSGLDR